MFVGGGEGGGKTVALVSRKLEMCELSAVPCSLSLSLSLV